MRLYRALLRLYPASFRTEYGREMRAVFEAERSAAGNIGSRTLLWIRALDDALRNAPRAHADILAQDLRYVLRTLRRAPGFTVAALLVASLGVGATTTAFSMANHVFLRPLPFPEPEELVLLWQDQSYRGYPQMELSPANYRDWKAMARSFAGMAAFTAMPVNLLGAGEPVRLDGILAAWDLFEVLGARPALGRTFTADDDRDGAPGTVILSDAVWRRLFAGDRAVLGRRVLLDDEPHEIIGVMPASFQFPDRDAALWRPARLHPRLFTDRANTFLDVVGRLRDGVTIDAARAEMRVIAARLEREYPDANARTGASLSLLRQQVSQRSRQMLLAIGGASACVLLIACTNLAGLLLARATARRRELAVRIAMGAGAERLVRQLLTESLVLAGAGGLLGIGLAALAAPLVGRLVPITLPIPDVPGIDWRVLLFALAVTGATGLTFGVLPALRIRRDSAFTSLREGARAGTGRGTERLRSGLVVAEVAACVVLLVVCGLFVRALTRVLEIDPGFEASGVLTLRTTLPMGKYGETARRMQFYARVLDDVQALPGVARAAYISFLPMVMRGGIWAVTADGRTHTETSERVASLRQVTPGFFETLGIPLLAGRDVLPSDTLTSPRVAVVSRSFVDQHWPGVNPLGRRFSFAVGEYTVVGVVGDIRVRGLERTDSEPQMYIPAAQVPDRALPFYAPKDLAIRASVPPEMLATAVRAIIARADPQQPVSDIRPLADLVGSETATRETQLRALVAFSATAFVLAALGIHGLLAFRVSARLHEFGVRRALGAQTGRIVAMVLRQALVLTAGGIVVGLLLAWYAGRSLESLLAGIPPTDAVSASAAIALTLVMAVAGSVVPALRAVQVDPARALRAE